MRAYTITLYVNDGTANRGSSNSIGANLADMGSLSWSLDEQLTKATPGDLTLKLWDEDGSLWTWLDTQLNTTIAGAAQLFPPWIVVTFAGTTVFLGLVDPAGVQRDIKTNIIELAAKDWSVMLTNLSLDGADWQRPLPKVISSRTGVGPWTGTMDPTLYNYGIRNVLQFNPVTDLAILSSVQAGDTVTITGTPSGSFKVISVGASYSGFYDNGNTPYQLQIEFDAAFVAVSGNSYSVSRPSATLGDSPYYTVVGNRAETEFVMKLDTVDWLSPGDVLQTVAGAEIAVEDIDTERNEVINSAQIGTALRDGDKLYLSESSKETIIYAEAKELLTKAVRPYAVNLSRLAPPTGSTPVMSWLPLKSNGQYLRGVSDLEPTLTAVRILGSNNAAYTGSPTLGWTEGTTGTRVVDWTCQQSAAPASLMPDTTPANAPMMGSRNRVYREWKNVYPANLDGSWNQIAPTYDATLAYPSAIICHDYSQLRRIICTNPSSGTASLSETRWTGSAWTGATVAAWPIASWYPVSMVPMIGTAATTGPVAPQGKALLALAYGPAGAVELQLAFAAGGFYRLALTSEFNGAKLRTTPWGVFLLSKAGYFGKVSFSGSALSVSGSNMGNASSGLIPTTFCATSATDIYCMGQLTTDPDAQGKTITEVHLYKLSSAPASGVNPVLRSEKVMTGAPRLAVAVRDPSSSTRILGLFGNRLFQISATLPTTIERVRATGMTGAELVEHIAQVLNALVVPRATGEIQIVGRTQTGARTDVTVDRTKVSQVRLSENFFSVVRVVGANEDIYQDAFGATKGGRALEIDSQPCIWTEGGAYALALAYAEFFGAPRRVEKQSWFSDDPNATPIWETLLPWQIIRPTGSTRDWFLMGLSYNLVKGEAEVTLLEKV